MAAEWGICSICGAVVGLRSVPAPGVPEAMVEHMKTHEAATPSAPAPVSPAVKHVKRTVGPLRGQ